MTQRRLTSRRNVLAKRVDLVIADLVSAMSPADVARKYGVARSTVHDFGIKHATRINELKAIARRRVSDYAIADVVNRIEALDDRWGRMRNLIAIRAADDRYDEPGYETGLMARSVKTVGTGDMQERVEVFAVDTALLAELRATERAAAEQLSQLPKPGDVTVNAGEGSKVLIVTSEPELGF